MRTGKLVAMAMAIFCLGHGVGVAFADPGSDFDPSWEAAGADADSVILHKDAKGFMFLSMVVPKGIYGSAAQSLTNDGWRAVGHKASDQCVVTPMEADATRVWVRCEKTCGWFNPQGGGTLIKYAMNDSVAIDRIGQLADLLWSAIRTNLAAADRMCSSDEMPVSEKGRGKQ
jgi:hypothetical protein